MSRPPVVLTIAGSDPSGGAGIQADLKTFSALGAYGTTVLTSLTAQSTRGVRAVHPVPAEFVQQQWRTLVEDVRVDALKIGMLGSAAVADVVRRLLDEDRVPHTVLDPVMVATSGDRLLDPEALESLLALLPRCSLVTPNLAEAATLLQAPVATSVEEMVDQAQALIALGAQRVLLKGGHLTGPGAADGRPTHAVDVFVDARGTLPLHAPRVPTDNTHGTGCSLSAALAAQRCTHRSWREAARRAKSWLTGALRRADELQVGHGPGPVHHFHELW